MYLAEILVCSPLVRKYLLMAHFVFFLGSFRFVLRYVPGLGGFLYTDVNRDIFASGKKHRSNPGGLLIFNVTVLIYISMHCNCLAF